MVQEMGHGSKDGAWFKRWGLVQEMGLGSTDGHGLRDGAWFERWGMVQEMGHGSRDGTWFKRLVVEEMNENGLKINGDDCVMCTTFKIEHNFTKNIR